MCDRCACCHAPDSGACDQYEGGMNGRCVYCDHDKACHPGRGRFFNTPLGIGMRGPVPDEPPPPGDAMSERHADGPVIHDGAIHDPKGCPRGRSDCWPLARYASDGYESFMCCGEPKSAPVPTDRLRLCVKSTHDHGVDVLVNFDERDAVHTASVLLGGLSALGAAKITATGVLREAAAQR